jgi:hypothetical protein
MRSGEMQGRLARRLWFLDPRRLRRDQRRDGLTPAGVLHIDLVTPHKRSQYSLTRIHRWGFGRVEIGCGGWLAVRGVVWEL